MVHARDVTIPDNLSELGTIGTQIKIWSDLSATMISAATLDHMGDALKKVRSEEGRRCTSLMYHPSWRLVLNYYRGMSFIDSNVICRIRHAHRN